MIKFNGRLQFKQFLPNKPVKYGVKAFLLCDSTTYYCYSFEIYTGKNNEVRTLNSTERTVINITKDIIGKQNIVFMDNYYTSYKLANYFISNGTGIVGTIRKNRVQ